MMHSNSINKKKLNKRSNEYHENLEYENKRIKSSRDQLYLVPALQTGNSNDECGHSSNARCISKEKVLEPFLENSTVFESEKINTEEPEQNFLIDGEIIRITNNIAISEKEAKDTAFNVINDLKIALRNNNIDYELYTYGSYINGLGCQNSDIDFFLKYKHKSYFRKNTPNDIKRSLYKSKLFNNIYYISKARIPILKFVHISTGKECDLSFSNEIGMKNSLLVKLYLAINKNLKPLVLFLKYLLQKYDLHGTGKITTYMLFWLAIFYMQQKKLLPSVINIRNSSTNNVFISGWNCSVPATFSCVVNDTSSLFAHVKEFFKFYLDFEFLKFIISPYMGSTFSINDFECLNIPVEPFATYLRKMKNKNDFKFSCHLINLQDASELNLNITKQIDINTANKFKSLCFIMHKILSHERTLKTKESLVNMLPNSIPGKNNTSDKCMQYLCTCFSLQQMSTKHLSMLEQIGYRYFENILRQIMETVLKFSVKSIFLDNVQKINLRQNTLEKYDVSMGYFECNTEVNEWNNIEVSHMIFEERKNFVKKYEPLKVFIVYEPTMNKKEIRINVESNANFIKFMRHINLSILLKIMLKSEEK